MRSLAPIVGSLAGALLAGCGGGPAGPSAAHPALIQVATSPHYIVRAATRLKISVQIVRPAGHRFPGHGQRNQR